jgi:DNA gyrase/topoisomerase IV subunit A
VITTEQIEEWIREAEERPGTAPVIVRFVGKRLRDLSKRNEELLAENIALRSEKRVDEYEQRIASLEYQLELLKRQMGGELPMLAHQSTHASLIVYTPQGRVIHGEIDTDNLSAGLSVFQREGAEAENLVQLLITTNHEELLFVFDSGRTVTIAVNAIPKTSAASYNWGDAYLVEPHSGEELVTILPVGKMALYDYCVQMSRRGCAKRIMKSSFESHLAKNYIGSGVSSRPDQTCSLALCGKDDRIVMASREGYLLGLEVSRLPYTTEEALRLSATDYIVSGFNIGSRSQLLAVTENGKVLQREASWLENAVSNKGRGQAIISPSRRESGARLLAAVPVSEQDWAAALHQGGQVTVHPVSDLLAHGSLESDDTRLAAFTTFSSSNLGEPV